MSTGVWLWRAIGRCRSVFAARGHAAVRPNLLLLFVASSFLAQVPRPPATQSLRINDPTTAFDSIEVSAAVLPSLGLRSLGEVDVDVQAGTAVVVDPLGRTGQPGRLEMDYAPGLPMAIKVSVQKPPVDGLHLRLRGVAVGGEGRAARIIEDASAPTEIRAGDFDGEAAVQISVGYELTADARLHDGQYHHPMGITVEASYMLGG